MKTYVYIDGFNLYYGCLKDSPYKWLDIKALSQKLLKSENNIVKIKYFTARASDKIKEGTSARQQRYIQALESIPECEIYWGNFVTRDKLRKIASFTTSQEFDIAKIKQILVEKNGLSLKKADSVIESTWKYASVLITEEKGSDVNLASHLIHDAHQNAFDTALVISNDTDLREPIRITVHEIGKKVGIACPHQRIAPSLSDIPPTFIRHISSNHLKSSQFPSIITNIEKPDRWNK